MQLANALKLTALFLVLLVVGDRVLATAGRFVVDGSPDRFVRIYSKSYDADVIVLGDSRADRHFPANRLSRALGVEVMNLGIGAESMALAEILLSDYLDQGRTPERVLIEVNCLVVAPERVGDMHFFGLYSDRIREHVRRSQPNVYFASKLLRLVHYNSGMFYRALFAHINPKADRLHAAAISEAAVERLRREPQRTFRIYDENIAALRRIAQMSAEKGFELELFAAPYLPVYEDRRQVLAVDQWLADVGSRLGDELTVRDYTDLVTERRYFRDSVHLNAEGVRVFIDRLMADGVFSAEASAIAEARERWQRLWERSGRQDNVN